jgi:hypothetical protein
MAGVRVPARDVAVLFGLPVTSTLCCTGGRSTRTASGRLEPPRPPTEGEVHHLEAWTGVLHLAGHPNDETHPPPGGLHVEWPVA